MRTAAILPVKSFERAKSAPRRERRRATAARAGRAMVADVLLALAQTASIELTIVVTRERSVAHAAREHGAQLVARRRSEDGPVGGRRRSACAVRSRRGSSGCCCIPGDCPALDPRELESLLASHGPADGSAGEVVIVPDRHGTRHQRSAAHARPMRSLPASGRTAASDTTGSRSPRASACRLERPRSLLLDIDTGADLAGAARPPGGRSHAVPSAPAPCSASRNPSDILSHHQHRLSATAHHREPERPCPRWHPRAARRGRPRRLIAAAARPRAARRRSRWRSPTRRSPRREGALVALADVQPSARARELAAPSRTRDPRVVQVVLDQSAEILRAERGVLICRTRHGFVCANAGVDASNAERSPTRSCCSRATPTPRRGRSARA